MNYTQTQEVNIAMNSNRDLFEKASVPKAVALMAIPTIVTMLVVVIYNMADTFFIGQTGDALQVAAVSLATPVFMVFMALGNLFGIGGSSAISRALGEKNEQRARQISAFCCYGSLGVGILMTLIFILFMDGILKMIGASPATIDYARQYLTFVAIGAPFVMFGTAYGNIVRGEGAAKESMIGNLIGTITNIILDPIMILWLGWGVSGAAVATVLGNVAACIFYLYYLLHKKETVLSIKPSDFQWKNRIASGVFSIGIPASLNNILMSCANILLNKVLISYGDTPVAAMGIAMKANMIVILLQIGLCAGIQPLIGYNYGARNVKRLKKIFFFTGLCRHYGYCTYAPNGNCPQADHPCIYQRSGSRHFRHQNDDRTSAFRSCYRYFVLMYQYLAGNGKSTAVSFAYGMSSGTCLHPNALYPE